MTETVETFACLLLTLIIIGCGEERTEVITIGPYTVRCQGAFEQDCFLKYNETAETWELFYEGIQGFDFEPGYIYELKVRLEERGAEIQDAGQYAYYLEEVITKIPVPIKKEPQEP